MKVTLCGDPTVRKIVCAGLLMTAGVLGPAVLPSVHVKAQPAVEASGPVQRIDLRASLLHAGSTGVEVQQILGKPSAATLLGSSESRDAALVYGSDPVRTRVVLTSDRVTAIALDLVYVDPTPLPTRARAIKPTMVRGGVTALLGLPEADQRWAEAGFDIERMTYARTDGAEFSVFLVDGQVADVRLGRETPAGLTSMLLPRVANSNELTIGQTPAQAIPLLGPMESGTHFTLKGQPVEYGIYQERDGDRLVYVTFTGGVLTAFAIRSPVS